MSLISGQMNVHERYQTDRKRDWMHVQSLWSDAAARKVLDVADEMAQQDQTYRHALREVDAMFDKADKLLGPI